MPNTALVVHLDIVPEHTEEFLDLARKHGANSVKIEEHCLRFEVLRSQEDPNHIVLVEVYGDDEALESHWSSEHMAAYLEKVKDMIANRQRYRCEL